MKINKLAITLKRWKSIPLNVAMIRMMVVLDTYWFDSVREVALSVGKKLDKPEFKTISEDGTIINELTCELEAMNRNITDDQIRQIMSDGLYSSDAWDCEDDDCCVHCGEEGGCDCEVRLSGFEEHSNDPPF